MDVVQVDYADLILFCESKSTNDQTTKILAKIEAAYGPDGLGILEISDVPDFERKRQALLPLAAQLPHLTDLEDLVDAESMYSIGWSHGKEMLGGQPDTAKGSFYAKPFDDTTQNRWPSASLPALETAFVDMSRTLQEIGCRIAYVCDAYCATRGVVGTGMAQSLQASHNATGRLLHYFAAAADAAATQETASSATWCAWHKDHVRIWCAITEQHDTYTCTQHHEHTGHVDRSRSWVISR